LFIRHPALPVWSLRQRPLEDSDRKGLLVEVEIMPDSSLVVLSNLTAGEIPPLNFALFWAGLKLWSPRLDDAMAESQTRGAYSDGVIGLIKGSVMTPAEISEAAIDLKLDEQASMLRTCQDFVGPPSCYEACILGGSLAASKPSHGHLDVMLEVAVQGCNVVSRLYLEAPNSFRLAVAG